jgi:glutamate-1-semialdehyde 2,1-aminomutase
MAAAVKSWNSWQPAGPVYQAGTLSGNPLAMTAGIATLTELERPGVWDRVATATEALAHRIECLATKRGIPARVQRVGTMLTVFFTDQPVHDWESARRCDTARFGRVFRRLLERGVYWVPSQFESAFLSTAHGQMELGHTGEAFESALDEEAREAR